MLFLKPLCGAVTVVRASRQVLGASSQGVWFSAQLAWPPGTDIVELGEEFAPTDLSAGKLLCCHKVFKVTVVCEYYDRVVDALEFSSPRFKGADYS